MAETPYLIAITGGSGSGKSTLAEALARHVPQAEAIIFHEDGYYWPRSQTPQQAQELETPGWESIINFDDPASKDTGLMAHHLAQLKSGQTIEQPIYDYDKHDRAVETLTITPKKLLILEGIHVLSIAQIAPLIDLSIYVDTPDDLRLARRLRRDVTERQRSVESVLGQYLSTVRAAHYRFTYPTKFQADLVIADEGLPAYGEVTPSDTAIARMMAPILTRLHADEVF